MRRNQSVIGFFLPQIMKNYDMYQASFKELLGFIESGDLASDDWRHVQTGRGCGCTSTEVQGRKTMGKLLLVP